MFEPFDWIIWTVNVWRLIWWLGQFHSNEIVCKRKFIRPLPIYSESIFGNPINHSHSSFAWIWTYIWLCAHSKENIWKFISSECWTTLLLRPKFAMHNGYSVCSLHVILSFSVIKMFGIINVRLWKLILTSCWEKFRTRNELTRSSSWFNRTRGISLIYTRSTSSTSKRNYCTSIAFKFQIFNLYFTLNEVYYRALKRSTFAPFFRAQHRLLDKLFSDVPLTFTFVLLSILKSSMSVCSTPRG